MGKLILGCIYSPSAFEASFYSKLMADLFSNTSPLIVLVGDLNACLEPKLDQWLNPSLLSNPTFVSLLEEQLVSALTLWGAAKAYIRGVIISYTSAKRKEALRKQVELESQVTEV